MLLLGIILTLLGAIAVVYTNFHAQGSSYRVVWSFCILNVGLFVVVLAVLSS